MTAGARCPSRPAGRRAFGAALAGLLLAVVGPDSRAQPLDAAQDLQRDIAAAAARGQPLLVLATLAGCPYCEVVRRHYLQPLQAAGQVTVRLLDLRSTASLRGPRGETARGSDLARGWGVRMAPTVLLLGPGGTELAPRLTGFSEDYYGSYLDDALAQARARLGSGRG